MLLLPAATKGERARCSRRQILEYPAHRGVSYSGCKPQLSAAGAAIGFLMLLVPCRHAVVNAAMLRAMRPINAFVISGTLHGPVCPAPPCPALPTSGVTPSLVV